MAEKTLNTRIQQKHDIEANWLKAVNFIPKVGEVIVYDIDETHTTPRMKIGDGVKNINELEFIGEKAAAPDWNANEGEPGYIENRTHWEEKEINVALEEVSIPYDTSYHCFYITDEFNFFPLEGTAYVTFNGERYETKCTYSDEGGLDAIYFYIGNKFIRYGSEENTGEPFLIQICYYVINSSYSPKECYLLTNPDITGTITLKIEGIKHNVQQLDPIFLTNSNITNGAKQSSIRMLNTWEEIGRNAFAAGLYTTALGDNSHAEGRSTTASGEASHAEGASTTASGNCSHAEGENTTASEYDSHAEGSITTASGTASHAEGGNTTASGSCSHAQGYNTIASGSNSHAEGYSSAASGNHSHAEGYQTTAGGDRSHAEGTGTIASGDSSHVQGRLNLEDTENKYAHIVGNGTSRAKRSNAHTLDWSGNGWFAGGLKVGGTSQDDKAAVSVLTEKDMTAITNAEIDILFQ